MTLYRQLGGGNWVRCVVYTLSLFCGPLLLTFMFLNTVAIFYKSTAALPFGTICIIIVLWALVTLPLTLLGAIAGKNSKVQKGGKGGGGEVGREGGGGKVGREGGGGGKGAKITLPLMLLGAVDGINSKVRGVESGR